MTTEDKELLRQAVLETLASSYPVPRTEAALTRLAQRQVPAGVLETDVLAALHILKQLALAEFTFDTLGSTRWWTATAAGVLQIERSVFPPPRNHN